MVKKGIDSKYCSNCGFLNSAEVNFCNNCGFNFQTGSSFQPQLDNLPQTVYQQQSIDHTLVRSAVYQSSISKEVISPNFQLLRVLWLNLFVWAAIYPGAVALDRSIESIVTTFLGVRNWSVHFHNLCL